MSELRDMAAGLLEHPVVSRPPVVELRRRNQRRRHRRVATTGGVVAVVALVITFVIVAVPAQQDRMPSSKSSMGLAAFIQKGVDVPDSVLKAVGRPAGVRALTAVQGQPPLSAGGKPALVFVGAQWCPPCAFQRWALLVALSRFGSFSNLGQFVIPASPSGLPMPESWSFTGSTYSSSLLSFQPAELPPSSTTTPGGQTVPPGSLTPLQQAAYNALEGSDPSSQGIPFTDVANRFWVSGSQAAMGPDNVLQGLSLAQIAADLSNSSSPVAQLIDGAANYLIADICAVVGTQSVPICSFDT